MKKTILLLTIASGRATDWCPGSLVPANGFTVPEEPDVRVDCQQSEDNCPDQSEDCEADKCNSIAKFLCCENCLVEGDTHINCMMRNIASACYWTCVDLNGDETPCFEGITFDDPNAVTTEDPPNIYGTYLFLPYTQVVPVPGRPEAMIACDSGDDDNPGCDSNRCWVATSGVCAQMDTLKNFDSAIDCVIYYIHSVSETSCRWSCLDMDDFKDAPCYKSLEPADEPYAAPPGWWASFDDMTGPGGGQTGEDASDSAHGTEDDPGGSGGTEGPGESTVRIPPSDSSGSPVLLTAGVAFGSVIGLGSLAAVGGCYAYKRRQFDTWKADVPPHDNFRRSAALPPENLNRPAVEDTLQGWGGWFASRDATSSSGVESSYVDLQSATPMFFDRLTRRASYGAASVEPQPSILAFNAPGSPHSPPFQPSPFHDDLESARRQTGRRTTFGALPMIAGTTFTPEVVVERPVGIVPNLSRMPMAGPGPMSARVEGCASPHNLPPSFFTARQSYAAADLEYKPGRRWSADISPTATTSPFAPAPREGPTESMGSLSPKTPPHVRRASAF